MVLNRLLGRRKREADEEGEARSPPARKARSAAKNHAQDDNKSETRSSPARKTRLAAKNDKLRVVKGSSQFISACTGFDETICQKF